MEFNKRDEETLTQYQIRLYRNKEAYNLSNDEIGRLLNDASGNCYDESKWRKYAIAFIDGYDEAIESNMTSDKYITELRIAKEELFKEKVRNQDALRQYRSMLRDVAREENLHDVLIETIKNLDPIEIKESKLTHTDKSKIGVLTLSDWHYGDFIDDFTNQFNHDIFVERINILIEKSKKIILENKLDELVVLNLGDLVSGSIHVSTRVIEECDVLSQTMTVAQYIEKILSTLSSSVNKIRYYSVTDNHSRTNKNKKDHIEAENFNRIVQWYLKERFKDHSSVEIKDTYIGSHQELEIGKAELFDSVILFSHGHHDNPRSIVQDLTLMVKDFPTAVFMGHLHKNFHDEIHSVDLIMSPSLIGANEYAKSIRRTSKPSQKISIFENYDGKAILSNVHTMLLKE